MLLTRSIRRKLALALALVLCLVSLSAACSVRGVYSCRRMVRDLELSIKNLPRRDGLVATVSDVLKPFAHDFPAPMQYEEFRDNFAKVRERAREFEDNWKSLDDSLQHSYAENGTYALLFSSVSSSLNEIESGMSRLADSQTYEQQKNSILRSVTQVISAIEALPDPANRLNEKLLQARSDYSLQLRLVSGLGAFSVVLVIGLMFWGYNLIFMPLRKLHHGVRRVADGDYSHRLKIDTQCEISHLAHAFNQMAQRIQEEQRNQSRAIEERSKQLVLSERLVGAGFLASGVAHEINNPLSVIMTAAYGLEMRLDDQALSQLSEADRADIREYLGLIQSEAERCERITKKLLDFSYGKDQERNRYDVTAIAAEVAAMVGHLSRYQDRKLTLSQTLPLHAWVNAAEIKQVLLNLVANGLDATGPGGRVEIELSELPDEVEITVRDNGCGMTREQMQHIFEPFFTTKEVGKGTGLGLSITHRIVRDHGGTLEVHSAGTGQGSSFTLRLPKAARRSQAA
ncbi:sensor histidine kinase [Planctomicrobium sp. SH664]|uniref:sensor histidine kinase n=1 Tax=Planctomicrobium sp. SH664 TaxID=3448125 RepID=UPI003F5C4F90